MNRDGVLVVGGLASSLVNFRGPLIEELLSNGFEVHTAAGGSTEKDRKELAQLGVGFTELPIRRTSLNPIDDLQLLRFLVKLLRNRRPLVVVTYTIKPNIYGGLVCSLLRIPHVAMVTGLGFVFTPPKTYKDRIVSFMAARLYAAGLHRTAHVFFQNPDDLQRFRDIKVLKASTSTSIVRGSGVDVSHFGLSPMPEFCSFLFVGRITREKGFVEFADACRFLKRSNPGVRIVVVGWIDSNPRGITQRDLDGWMREELFEFVGPVDDVRPYLDACQVLVLPSYGEGTPRSVLEAMSVGRAVIGTDVPGTREAVIHGITGLLVQARSSKALWEAMKHCIVHPVEVRNMGLQGRKRVEELYESGRVAKNMVNEILRTTGVSTTSATGGM